MMNKIELLAPAGSFEALKAAVQNGADAVYLGGTIFGARAYASNFDEIRLKEALEYAHIRGVKIYVTVNTLIKDKEIPQLLKYIGFLYEIGVNAVIVQDLGVVDIIQEVFPDLPIHCSTQMALHNSEGAKILKKAGVQRIVLARELNTEEIKTIHKATNTDLEVFVHGALCYSYSGQCLMSSFIGGRSGNRGRCAQPCRRQYQLVSSNKDTDFQAKGFLISTRDLNTLEDIGKIIESGATSFKIEGRMKKPEYVAAIVKAYRQAIDIYMASKESFQDEAIDREVTQIFNRKFTKGYILSNGDDILNIEKPNNRGLLLGIVGNYFKKKKTLQIKLLENLWQGDGIEVVAAKGESVGGIVNKMYRDKQLIHEAKKGETIEIQLEGDIEKHAKVYKTLDLQLMKKLATTYNQGTEKRKVNIYGEMKISMNEPLQLYIWDDEGNTAEGKSDVPVERAREVALTEEKAMQNLQKLGNTPFSFKNINIDIEEGVSIPIAIINQLRRDVVGCLMDIRKDRGKRKLHQIDKINILSKGSVDEEGIPGIKIDVTVGVNTLNQLKEALEENIDRIYYGDLYTLDTAVALCKRKNKQIYFKSPSIIKDHELGRMERKLRDYPINGILAGDLAMIAIAKNYLKLPAMGDMSLNIMNSRSMKFLLELGIETATISPELELKDIRNLQAKYKVHTEAIIYGKLPVMITETCPLIKQKQCDNHCEACKQERYSYKWGLRDEKNITFPFTKDFLGRTIIMNSKPIYMMDKIGDLLGTNIHSYRLEFTDEGPHEITKIIRGYLKAINNEKGTQNIEIKDFTRGHFYRGVE